MFMSLSLLVTAQEICDNGIDDDGDTFIDLNDDECGCDEVVPITDISGSVCNNTRFLIMDQPTATSFQWYKDGVALTGATSPNLRIFESLPTGEGTYECLMTTATGCLISESHEAIIDSYYTYLGEQYICAGESYEFGPWSIDIPGNFSYTAQAVQDGCDSLLVVDVYVTQDDIYRESITLCEGTSYEFGSVIITEDGPYEHAFESRGGCDSVVRLEVTFAPLDPIEFSVSICEGEEYTFKDISETESGIYETMVTSAEGCDTIFLIDLDVMAPTVTELNENYCSGGSYEKDGQVYDTPGLHTYALQDADGCDSIINLTLTELDPEQNFLQESICRGKVYNYQDISETETGTYQTLVQMPGECDVLVIVELTVEDPMPQTESANICQGEIFEWRGQSFDATGNYEDVVETPDECDELFQLNLIVELPDPIKESYVLCPSELPYEFGDIKADETGTYTTTIAAPGECDKLYEIALEVLENTEHTFDASICDGETFDYSDISETTAGTYTTMLTNSVGCDSLVTVNLVASAITTTPENAAICPGDSYDWYGDVLTEGGDYPVTLQAENGCDSIVVLTLDINTELAVYRQASICENETYEFYDRTLSEENTYETTVITGTGCDSIITLDLEVRLSSEYEMNAQICDGETFSQDGISESEAGTYFSVITNQAGCDSTIVINLDVIKHDPSFMEASICEGESFSFAGSDLEAAGMYPEMITSSVGCDSLVTLDLTVLPKSESEEQVLICPGDLFTYLNLTITEAGTYQTVVTNSVGCDSTITLMVEVDETAGDLDLGDDLLINIGSSVDIDPAYIANDLESIEWYDEEGNLISTDPTLSDFAPLEDTYVEVTAVNDNGCELRERLFIDVELIIDIYVPNVMTPEIDDPNMYFTVGANESVVGIQELHIFDRWGELLFTDDHDGNLDTYIGWDGTFKGETVLSGVYTYMVIFEIIDGTTVTKAGTVTVLK